MKVGIIGFGFVGDALHNGLNIRFTSDISIYDPNKLPKSSIKDVKGTNVVFICVPTPMSKNGDIDGSIVRDVLRKLSRIRYKGIVVIKSTLRPDIGLRLLKSYKKLRIVANPEFLTERTARQDFLDSKWVIIGGCDDDTKLIYKIFDRCFPLAKIVCTDFQTALMAKYVTNVWFAVKVSLMNEIYQMAKSNDIDWDDLVKVFSADKRVGNTHLSVPGPDGDTGFGGKCFPKDLNAFIAWSNKLGTVNNVMKAAWNTNLSVRKNKDWLNIDGAVTDLYKELQK